MIIELSAKELAYVTMVVGKQQGEDGSIPAVVGVAAYEALHDACCKDIQAITYLHAFEQGQAYQVAV